MGGRFLFDNITTVILIVKHSTQKTLKVSSMVGIRLQDWPYIETALGKCNLIIKTSIYRVDMETQPGQPARVTASFYSRNE